MAADNIPLAEVLRRVVRRDPEERNSDESEEDILDFSGDSESDSDFGHVVPQVDDSSEDSSNDVEGEHY